MALSSGADEQRGASDGASTLSPSLALDPIAALDNASRPSSLAAWLDQFATPTTTSNSKLEDISATLRQLSLSLSSIRDASRNEQDQIITSLISTIPKTSIELKLMSETVSTLQTRVKFLQSQSSTRDVATETTLARIAALSKAKVGLIDARHALREAQAWSTLESQVNMLLGEQRWQEAVERLVKAADSLRLFSGSAKSNEERSALLETLTQRIHEQLIPVLHESILTRETDKIACMAKLFVQTKDGATTFFRVYARTRSQPLLLQWAQTASESSSKSLPTQLASLFGDLLALLGAERLTASSLFNEPSTAIQLLTADVLARLDPPIHACIQQATRAPDLETFLAALTDAYKATEEAIRAVQSVLPEAKAMQHDPDDKLKSSGPPINSQLLTLEATDKSWLRLMLEPFIPYQTRLATLEAEAMQSRLHALQASSSSSSIPISAASSQATQVVKAALRRTAALTKSFATPLLVPSLDSTYEAAMAQAHVGLETELQHVLSEVHNRIRRLHQSVGAGHTALTYDERGDVLTSNDWDEFRKATERIAACREAIAAVRALEETIAYQISELGAIAKVPTSDDEQVGVDFSSPTSALATSTLNSATLHELVAKSKRLLSATAWNSSTTDLLLLPATRAAILSIATTVQTFQHDLVLSQFLPELELYPSLAIWTSTKHPSILNEYDLAMPKFSLSPTEAMARVGEAMLNLPRLFEGYADEVLLFCLHRVSGGEADSNGAAIRVTGEPAHARHPTMVTAAEMAAERSSMHRQAFSTTAIPSSPTRPRNNQGDEGEGDAGVLSQYLRSLLTLFFKRFLTSVLPSLPRLTEIGAAQLAADLDYLSNISSVIYSESEAILRYWKKAAEITTDTGRLLVTDYLVAIKGQQRPETRIGDLEGWKEEEVESLVRSDAFTTLARIRGWI